MKTTIAFVAFLVLAAPHGAFAQRLQLDSLDRLASRAAESVNISIDPAMLKMASAFIKGQGTEAEVKQLLSELKGIYVRSFEFTDAEPLAGELDGIRKQLATGAWTRLIAVDSKRDGEIVEVYSWREGEGSGGFAILVAEPRELTVVNIVGPIDLAKLGALQGNFGIPRLPRELGATPR